MRGNTDRRSPGRQLKVYRDRGVRPQDFFLWVIPGLALPAGALLIGAVLIANGYAQKNAQVPWAAAAGILLIPYAVLSVRAYRRSRRSVIVHANGLRLLHIQGPRRFVFWDQIQTLHTGGTRYHLFGAPISDRHSLRLQTRRGDEIRIQGFYTSLEELVEIIRKQTEPHRKKQLSQSEATDFGAVRFVPGGLQVQGRAVPWHALRTLQVHAGTLVIESSDHRWKLPAADIPNLDLLLALAADRTKTS